MKNTEMRKNGLGKLVIGCFGVALAFSCLVMPVNAKTKTNTAKKSNETTSTYSYVDQNGTCSSVKISSNYKDVNWSDDDIWNTTYGHNVAIASSYEEAYEKVIRRYDKYTKDNECYGEFRYELAYIDKDQTPELLVFLGDSHPMGVMVYQYKNNKVKNVGCGGSNGTIKVVLGKNLIWSNYTGMGACIDVLYSLSRGKEVVALESFEDITTGETYYYEGQPVVDFEENESNTISEKRYESQYGKYFADLKTVEYSYDNGYSGESMICAIYGGEVPIR